MNGEKGEILPKRVVERLREEIKREISKIIEFEAHDPRIGFVTVTDVELSSDLRYAQIFLDIFDDKQVEEVLQVFRKDRGFFRSELAKRLNLRYTPELKFSLDETTRRARRIERLLRNGESDVP